MYKVHAAKLEDITKIEDAAFFCGFNWVHYQKNQRVHVGVPCYIYLNCYSKQIATAISYPHSFVEVKIEDLDDLVGKIFRFSVDNPDLIVDGKPLTFYPNGSIKFGCKTLDAGLIDAILQRRERTMNDRQEV